MALRRRDLGDDGGAGTERRHRRGRWFGCPPRPYCDAPIRHLDHVHRRVNGGLTTPTGHIYTSSAPRPP